MYFNDMLEKITYSQHVSLIL